MRLLQLTVLSATLTLLASAQIFEKAPVSRSIQAIAYPNNSSSGVSFRATALMPGAKGTAKISPKGTVFEIEAKVEGLTAPSTLGPEYLTYVLWAVTNEGLASNLGELRSDDGKAGLKASTRLSSFALVVTAEPYFAITGPSDTVVLENAPNSSTIGTISNVEIKYALAVRNSHQEANSGPVPIDPRLPLDLFQARNAIRIAKMDDAERLAPEPMNRAKIDLLNAEGFAKSKSDKKLVIDSARQAVQAAEEARLVSIKEATQEKLTAERQAAAQRQADEKAAREAAEARQQAEKEARLEAEKKQQEEENARLKAEADTQKAEADRQKAEADRQKAETERQKAETAQLQAELRTSQEAQAKQQAEQATRDAAAKEQAARQDADRARAAAAELRASLLDQFNRVLPTRDTDRGLVVNMGDVLFDTGKYTLRQEAQIPLAKLSGLVVSHPGLRLDVEGHTDSVGSDDLNQKLSEQRAQAVEEFLAKQGVSNDNLSAKGFGKSRPVADNATVAGRQQNRRVEIVISGEVIGAQIGSQPN